MQFDDNPRPIGQIRLPPELMKLITPETPAEKMLSSRGDPSIRTPEQQDYREMARRQTDEYNKRF